MNKLLSFAGLFALCFAVAGCADGTLEVKTKTAPANPVIVVDKPSPVVVIEKPGESSTKETKTQTRSIDGSTTKTTETKTTNP